MKVDKNTIKEEIEKQQLLKGTTEIGVSEKIDVFLKSKLSILIFLLLLLIAQVKHTVYVFSLGSHESANFYAWIYAIGMEGAIMIFVVNGWRGISIAFSITTMLTNFMYGYYGVNQIPYPVTILISVMLSIAISGFSHLYYTRMKKQEEILKQAEQKNIDNIANEMAEKMSKPHICPYPDCNESFSEQSKLNGHISAHKRKHPKEWWDGLSYVGPNNPEEVLNQKDMSQINYSFVTEEQKDVLLPNQ